MTDSILIAGSIALDTVYARGSHATAALGGSATFAVLAAQLVLRCEKSSCQAHLLGAVGHDFPPEHLAKFVAHGVGLSALQREPHPTFSWVAEYDPADFNQRRTISSNTAIFDHWRVLVPPHLQAPTSVVACAIKPHLQLEILQQASAAGIKFCDFIDRYLLDNLQLVDEVISLCDVVLMNEREACLYANTDCLQTAGDYLLGKGATFAIIKQGERGSTLLGRDPILNTLCQRQCAAFLLAPDQVVDPTGAGDSYLGALAAYTALACANTGLPLSADILFAGMEYGSAVASFTCQSFSTAALEVATPADMQTRLQSICTRAERWVCFKREPL